MSIKVRVGLPKTGGALVKAARERGYSVLFSANAFALSFRPGHDRHMEFKGWSRPDLDQLQGLDAALDSAGYVAAAKYGDYRWTPEQYVDLAASFSWSWWASMDYCLEPQVAEDRPLRLLRMAATAQLLGRCNRLADERGISRPMPVIQGWLATEYEQSVEWLPIGAEGWPDIVGVGSVCRRQLHGEHGILRILDTLDRALPEHVKLHLFGVKSSTLEAIGAHPRIASMDSMAWDFGARIKRRTGRDMAFRIECMEEWAEAQLATAERIRLQRAGAPLHLRRLFNYKSLPKVDDESAKVALEALAMTYADLLLEGQLEYRDAVAYSQRDAYPVMAIIHQARGLLRPGVIEHLEEFAPGIGDHIARKMGWGDYEGESACDGYAPMRDAA